MDRCIERVVEAIVGIRREVHDDLRARRDRPGHLDVERDFAVGAVWLPRRRVVSAADRDGDNAGCLDAELREILVDIDGTIAAAELEDRDRLPLAVDAFGKVVQRRDLDRGERLRRCMRREPSAAGKRDDAAMRPHVRPIVESEHAFDDPSEVGRDRELSAADAKRLPPNHVALERGAKRILHRLDRACEVDRALGEAYAGNNQRVRVREGLDLGDIGRVCAVAGAELVVIERLEMLGIVGRGQW